MDRAKKKKLWEYRSKSYSRTFTVFISPAGRLCDLKFNKAKWVQSNHGWTVGVTSKMHQDPKISGIEGKEKSPFRVYTAIRSCGLLSLRESKRQENTRKDSEQTLFKSYPSILRIVRAFISATIPQIGDTDPSNLQDYYFEVFCSTLRHVRFGPLAPHLPIFHTTFASLSCNANTCKLVWVTCSQLFGGALLLLYASDVVRSIFCARTRERVRAREWEKLSLRYAKIAKIAMTNDKVTCIFAFEGTTENPFDLSDLCFCLKAKGKNAGR